MVNNLSMIKLCISETMKTHSHTIKTSLLLIIALRVGLHQVKLLLKQLVWVLISSDMTMDQLKMNLYMYATWILSLDNKLETFNKYLTMMVSLSHT